MNQYERYLLNQVGSGIGPYYRSSLQVQRGRGLGSVFSNLYRVLKPWIVSGSRALGQEVLRSGKEVIQNIDSDKPINLLLKEQGIKSLRNLTEKAANAMSGRGININLKRKIANDFTHARAKQLKVASRNKSVSGVGGKKAEKKKKKTTTNNKTKSLKGSAKKKKKKKTLKASSKKKKQSAASKKKNKTQKKKTQKKKNSSQAKARLSNKSSLISELFA